MLEMMFLGLGRHEEMLGFICSSNVCAWIIVKLTSGGFCGDRDIGKCVDIICMEVGWRADSFLALDLARNLIN